jgi:hypothetical protein
MANEKVYNRFKFRSASGATDWDSGDIRCLLLESTVAAAYDPDLNTVADLLAVGSVAEMVATNYARKAFTGEAVTQDDTNNRANLDASIPVWTALGVAAGTDGSAVALVVYDEGSGTDATRHLISYHDQNFPVITNGQDFTVNTPNDVVRLT